MTTTEAAPYKRIPCNYCGWCCQRSTCSMGAAAGAPLQGPCSFLVQEQERPDIYKCGLILQEKDAEIKKQREGEILAGDGCTHKFGPHPVSILKTLLERGLQVHSPAYRHVVSCTRQEYEQWAYAESNDPQSILVALQEFADFCRQLELAANSKT